MTANERSTRFLSQIKGILKGNKTTLEQIFLMSYNIKEAIAALFENFKPAHDPTIENLKIWSYQHILSKDIKKYLNSKNIKIPQGPVTLNLCTRLNQYDGKSLYINLMSKKIVKTGVLKSHDELRILDALINQNSFLKTFARYSLNIDKIIDDIKTLLKFRGSLTRCKIISSSQAFNNFLEYLKKNKKVIAIDTEWNVIFSGFGNSLLKLIQFAYFHDESDRSEIHCVLVYLNEKRKNYNSVAKKLHDLFANKDNTIVCFDISSDYSMLKKFFNAKFEIKNLVDLSNEIRPSKSQKYGLKSLINHLYKVNLSKELQISNWNCRFVNFEQLLYASLDVVLPLYVYSDKILKTKYDTVQ